MAGYTQPAWLAERGNDNYIAIRDFASGNVIALLPTDAAIRPQKETAGNAELIALAPELFRSVCELVAVMRDSDVELSPGKSVESEIWDAAMDEAQVLIELLAESGVTLNEASTPDGIVVLPLPMMTPPAVVIIFKAVDGDVTILVHADDDRKTLIGQWNVSSAMHGFVHTFLQEDGPLCGVLRHDKKIVGQISFLPGHRVELTLDDRSLTSELDPEDTADIINLFRER